MWNGAPVLFQMSHVSVFGVLLPFVGVVNQNVEAMSVRVIFHDGTELAFMQRHQFLDSLAKLLQQTFAFGAIEVEIRSVASGFRNPPFHLSRAPGATPARG